MTELIQELAVVIGAELGTALPPIDETTLLEDLPGWDSVALAGVLVALEGRFGVSAGRAEIEAIETVGDLARLCQAAPR